MKLNRILLLSAIFTSSTNVYSQQDTLKLSLQDIIEIADTKSNSIKESENIIKSAFYELENMKLQYTPSVDVSLTAGYQGNATLMNRNFSNTQSIVIPHFSNSLNIQINQPILDMELSRGLKTQRATNEVMNIQHEMQIQDVRFMLADWFMQYLKYLNIRNILGEDKKRIELLLEETSNKYEQGIALKSDVTYYKLELHKRNIDLIKNDNLLKILNYQFAKILDIPSDKTILPFGKVPSKEFLSSLQYSVTETLEYRVSVAKYNESLVNELLTKAMRWPKLSAWFENSLSGPLASSTPALNKNINNWGFGLKLSYNIDNFYRNNNKIKAAQFISKSNREHVELTIKQLDAELFGAWSKLDELIKEFDIRDEQVKLSEELYQLMYDRYSGGTAILTEMMDARKNLLQANMEYLNIKIEAYYQYCLIKKIMGEL